jgi:hypothetical protein
MPEFLIHQDLQAFVFKTDRRALHSKGFSIFYSMQITLPMLKFEHQRNRTLKTKYTKASTASGCNII